MTDREDSFPRVNERVGLSSSRNVLWICLGCAAFLDVLGAFEGLGFAPSFQLEAQPLFFLGMGATIFFILNAAKLGPLLAGVIFWIPIIVLAVEVLVDREIVPFGGDVVGIAELLIAIVGVVAAHNVYHKLKGGLFRPNPFRLKRNELQGHPRAS